ncbi:MAG: hypothetical protein PUC82_00095 [bacterium]|nr:hypothetical protein [bacterium]
MKRLPNISFTPEELQNIVKTGLFNKEGGEAIVTFSLNPHALYKIFIDTNTGEIIEMPENKLKKLSQLFKLQLQNSVKPLSTITMDKKLVGYEMTYDEANLPIGLVKFTRKEMIEVLKSTKNILEYFSAQDITYGDIKNNNILINQKTGQITFCDMDNVRIATYPIDLMGKDLKKYTDIHQAVDRTTDAYMHNLLTLKSLGFPNPYATSAGIIMSLEKEEYPTGFKEKAKPILKSMLTPETFTGEYIIQYIKR